MAYSPAGTASSQLWRASAMKDRTERYIGGPGRPVPCRSNTHTSDAYLWACGLSIWHEAPLAARATLLAILLISLLLQVMQACPASMSCKHLLQAWW